MELMKRIEEDINSFPEGSKNYSFFKQLLKKLEPDCVRESVRKELNESHADLSESMRQYFKQHIKYTSALKSVDLSQLQQNESASDNAEVFHLNLLKKYVHNDKSREKLKLFEGSQTLLTKILEGKQKSKSVELFTNLVEDNIKEFCINFSEYVLERKVRLHAWEKEFDIAVKQLSKRVGILDSAEAKLNPVTPELQILLSTYYKELAEGIEILYKLLELFQQKLDCQLNQSKVASDRSVHLNLKIKCLELEILISTYSKNAVEALQIIKTELRNKITASTDNIKSINDQLEQFQILGPEYDQLVEKYRQLIENIEKQKSAIEFLKDEIASKEK